MTQNISWQNHKITRVENEMLNSHRSFCLWFTGLSGAGKSTLANVVQQRLHHVGIHTYLMDGDNVRHGLNGDLGFSSEDRKENVRRVAEVAGLFVDAGIVVISALISPFERDRQMARNVFGAGDFVEVFVDCPIEICIERDPKGLYKKAEAGMIREFTGISSPYESPKSPELRVNTAEFTIEECVEQIMLYLKLWLSLSEVALHEAEFGQ